MTDNQLHKAVARVVSYIQSCGITVNLNSNSFGYYQEDSLITTPTQAAGTISLLIGLLHEAGHSQQPDSRFKSLRKSKKRNKCIILEQEYTAWQIGLEIAYHLDIVTKELYTQYTKAWMNYWTGYCIALYRDDNAEYIAQLASSYCRNTRVANKGKESEYP